MNLADYQWFAVKTAPKREKIAAESVRRLGYRSIYLHVSEWIEGQDETKLSVKPYLPSYIFVGLSPEHFSFGRPITDKIRCSRGVLYVVSAEPGRPLPIPQKAMQLITASAELPSGLVHTSQPVKRFAGRPGHTVRLGGNAYRGFRAAILDIDSNNGITVELDTFGRKVPTRITVEDVDALYDAHGVMIERSES